MQVIGIIEQFACRRPLLQIRERIIAKQLQFGAKIQHRQPRAADGVEVVCHRGSRQRRIDFFTRRHERNHKLPAPRRTKL